MLTTAHQERDGEQDHMPVPIKINSTEIVTPLFDIQHKEMLCNYRKGIHRQIQIKNGL